MEGCSDGSDWHGTPGRQALCEGPRGPRNGKAKDIMLRHIIHVHVHGYARPCRTYNTCMYMQNVHGVYMYTILYTSMTGHQTHNHMYMWCFTYMYNLSQVARI